MKAWALQWHHTPALGRAGLVGQLPVAWSPGPGYRAGEEEQPSCGGLGSAGGEVTAGTSAGNDNVGQFKDTEPCKLSRVPRWL